MEVYFGKMSKELTLVYLQKHFIVAKYIEYLEKNCIPSYNLVFSGLLILDCSDLRSLWMYWTLSQHVWYSFWPPCWAARRQIRLQSMPGNGIRRPNAENSLDLYCPCPPRKIDENMATMSLIIIFFHNHLPNFPQSLSEFDSSGVNIYSLSDLLMQK